jgi:hypothetical protein
MVHGSLPDKRIGASTTLLRHSASRAGRLSQLLFITSPLVWAQVVAASFGGKWGLV